jgi:hypothetical protein
MADDNISREKLYDPRIVQPPSRYAVSLGGSAITVTPFRAVAATSSQLSFSCNVPSQTVFLDRAVELNAQVTYLYDVRAYNDQPATAEALWVFGRDGALEALPVHSLISTLTVIINDSSVTVDLGSTMKELLRLTDYAANRSIRTAPTMLDRYQLNKDAANTVNSPFSGYENAVSDSEVPNGAWWDIVFANPNTGDTLVGTGNYSNAPGQAGIAGAANIAYVNGVPQRYAVGAVDEDVLYAAGGYYTMAVRFRTQEFLMASPLIFADSHEESVGIFGVNNMQVTANLKADVSRVIRCVASGTDVEAAAIAAGRVIGLGSALNLPASARFGVAPRLFSSQPFPEAVLNCTFISPSVNMKVPSVSMVPWQEYPFVGIVVA